MWDVIILFGQLFKLYLSVLMAQLKSGDGTVSLIDNTDRKASVYVSTSCHILGSDPRESKKAYLTFLELAATQLWKLSADPRFVVFIVNTHFKSVLSPVLLQKQGSDTSRFSSCR